jgi:hypothetical protein
MARTSWGKIGVAWPTGYSWPVTGCCQGGSKAGPCSL